MFFEGAWIFRGWEMVGWGRKSYLGPTEIASFSSRSFWHLNQIWFKYETPLLFLLIIFSYILFDQQSSADVLQNRCSYKFCYYHRKTPVLESLFKKVAGAQQRTPFLKNISGCSFLVSCTHMMSHAIWVDEIKLKLFEKIVFLNKFYKIFHEYLYQYRILVGAFF